MSRFLACTALLLLATSCSSERRRWANDPVLPVGLLDPSVSVSLAPAAAPENNKGSDLSDRAQGALVARLGQLSRSAKDLNSNVHDAFAKPNAHSGEADNTRLDRVLIINIWKGAYRPADRIIQANVTVLPTNFSFGGYSLVTTQYQTTDIEKSEIKNDYSASAEINPTLAGSIKGPFDIKTGIDHSTDRSYTVTETIPRPTVEIEPCKLVLRQSSTENEDLAGLSTIKLTLFANSITSSTAPPGQKTDCRNARAVTSFYLVANSAKLFDGTKPLLPAKAAIAAAPEEDLRGPLVARVSMDYVLRHVLKGGNTQIEDDDDVEITPGTVSMTSDSVDPADPSAVELVDGGGGPPVLWTLCAETGPLKAGLAARLPDGLRGPLFFKNLLLATEVREWLGISHSWNLGSTTLSVSGFQPVPPPTFRICRS